MNTKRTLISIVLVGLLLLPFFAFAENGAASENPDVTELNRQIEQKRERVKELEKSIEVYKKKIEQKRTEAASLTNQMAILDNHIAKVELDIEATEEKVETIALEIESLELAIEEKEQTIEKQKAILAEFIRTLHQKSGVSIIEVMATYEDFSEFFNQVQYLESIESDIADSTRSLKVAKATIEEKKKANQDRQTSYLELQEKLEQKKKDLDEQIYLKEDLLEQTESSEMTYQTLLSSLKKQYQQIEQEIVSIEQQVRARLEDQDKLEQDTSFDGKLSWPTPSRYVTAYFHDPTYPYRNVFEHNAIDIRAGQGTPIRAASSGYVGRAKHCSSASCYSYVMIIHSGGISTVYGHLSSISVSADQFVARGDVIGYSGGTPGTVGAGPFVTGPHLHFEVRQNGIPVNPLSYLVKDY